MVRSHSPRTVRAEREVEPATTHFHPRPSSPRIAEVQLCDPFGVEARLRRRSEPSWSRNRTRNF
ncbi:hypothetical protein BDV98DRAFT_576759 [Pterulicium gracile]|uniref:Uncharacterized protein n=1 Tax=Pterulicium gracile TaxID=1884261 RepID=A0A5C3Q6S3_9AGAR|nr:hypothetical protein BDV98DRAFT_576759 [Pterula gracilis]